MSINFIDALNESKKRARLTGQTMTPQETRGMTSGWFDTAAVMANKRRAQAIAEKQAEEKLAQEKMTIQEQMEAAKTAERNELIGNTTKDVVSGLGTDYLKSKPGESYLAKGWDLAKSWFGTGEGLAAPTTLGNIGADVAGLAGAGGQLAGSAGLDTGMTGLGYAAEPAASGLGSLTGGMGSAVSIAAPYYALAKGGGMLINAITDKNPELKETPFGLLGEGLRNPITGVERSVADAITDKIGGRSIGRVIAGIFNPSSFVQDLGGGCIIITACTSKDSPEVQIAREYRDKFLDKTQLRGYYVIAEKIVPLLERNEKVRKLCKKWLVDKLIDYGEKRLGQRQRPTKLISIIVSKLFLSLIKIIGVIVPHYTRKNGEVY